MMRLLFYTREPCELCDKAWEMMALAGLVEHVQAVNIDDDPELLNRYGDQVPVIRNEATGEKLAWPFTASQVRDLLEADE